MTLRLKNLEFNDFSGGITDKYLDSDPNTYQIADNFLISVNRKLETRPGTRPLFAGKALVSVTADKISQLLKFNYNEELLATSANRLYHYTAGAWASVLGLGGNELFPSATPTAKVTVGQADRHLYVACSEGKPPAKIIKTATGLKAVTAGLPSVPSPTVTGTPDASSRSYIYAFHYHHQYQSDGLTFEDFGPTTTLQISGVAAPSTTAVSVTGLTHISNTGLLNYDTVNTKIWIYRTISGGTTLYKIAEVSPGTTTYSDSTNDTVLVNNSAIYTTGGVLDNDPPPSDASHIHIESGVAYYASGKTLRQSIPLDYDACPIDFFLEFSSEIIAITSARDNVIVLTKDGVYRVNGTFDELGRGGMLASRLDNSVVCVSKMSVVQANDMVFFATQDGFVACDGFKITQISNELDESYSQLVESDAQAQRIFGLFHKTEQRVYWSVQDSTSISDPNGMWVLDLRWGLRPNSSFTKIRGSFDTFRPVSLQTWSGNLIWGTANGCVMKFDSAYTSDVVIDPSVADTLWNEIEIPYHFRSMGTSFGTHFARKWVPQAVFIMDSNTDISIQPGGINDDSSVVTKTSEIRVRQRFDWGDPTVIWSSSSGFMWNQTSIVKEKRMFKGRQVRCSYKQIDVQPAYINIAASDNYAIAGVNASLKTAYIDPITEYSWPLSIIGMDIYFEDDGYSKPYEIVSRSATTVQFLDPSNFITLNGNRKWVIRGKSRDERFTMLANILYYDVFSETYDAFPGVTGGNAS